MSTPNHKIANAAIRSRVSGLAVEEKVAGVIEGLGWVRPDEQTQTNVMRFIEAYDAIRGPALGQASQVEGLWWDAGSNELLHIECVGTFEDSAQPGLRKACSAMKLAGRLLLPWVAAELVDAPKPQPVVFTSHLPQRGSTSASTIGVVALCTGLQVGVVHEGDDSVEWVPPGRLATLSIAGGARSDNRLVKSLTRTPMTPSLFADTATD